MGSSTAGINKTKDLEAGPETVKYVAKMRSPRRYAPRDDISGCCHMCHCEARSAVAISNAVLLLYFFEHSKRA